MVHQLESSGHHAPRPERPLSLPTISVGSGEIVVANSDASALDPEVLAFCAHGAVTEPWACPLSRRANGRLHRTTSVHQSAARVPTILCVRIHVLTGRLLPPHCTGWPKSLVVVALVELLGGDTTSESARTRRRARVASAGLCVTGGTFPKI